jgi:hypothetical protein
VGSCVHCSSLGKVSEAKNSPHTEHSVFRVLVDMVTRTAGCDVEVEVERMVVESSWED